MGALRDDWMIYWYSLVSRVIAAVFLLYLGKPWSKLVGPELVTAAILGVSMWFA